MSAFVKALRGLALLPSCVRILNPTTLFKDKRIAIVGPAGSVFKEENGEFIDQFDYVIRINKAPYSLQPEKAKHQGMRTDILFHSFYENNETGGGPLNFALYKEKKIRYVVNPRNDFRGWRMSFNFYKKYLLKETTYLLPSALYKRMLKPFGKLRPTIGFTALQAAVESPCKEVFVTGFTFFKTPYAPGYRDNLIDLEVNKKHLKDHGVHDPDLEFTLFSKLIDNSLVQKLHFDKELTQIIASHKQ